MPICSMHQMEKRIKWSKYSTFVAVSVDFLFLYPFSDCGKENTLDQKSVIRCIVCGHRIFYKKRERKLLQYEAR